MSVLFFNSLGSDYFSSSCLKELLPCEWKLLLLIADDLPNDEIIELMFISRKSVETYFTRIGDKLQMKGNGKVSRFARKNKELLKVFYAKIYLQ